MHGDPPERVSAKILDMQALREKNSLPPLVYGVAGYVVCRATETAAKREIERITDVRQNTAGYANYEQWLAHAPRGPRATPANFSAPNPRPNAGPTRPP